MEYLVNSSEMKRCDSFIINEIGIPSMVLMEKAALVAVEELEKGSFDLTKVLIVVGAGNNGADGLAMARLLHLKEIEVDVLFVGDEASGTVENKKQLEILRNYDVKVFEHLGVNDYTTIVDAIFGIGLSGEVRAEHAKIINKINQSAIDVLSVDVPSGISASTGKILGVAVKAKSTVSFAYNKIGLVLYPGAKHAGTIKVKDIGITDIGFKDNVPKVYSYTQKDLKRLPQRQNYSNKGTYGKVLIIAGGINMSGAAYLSAKSAYKMGAGLVKIYTAEENRIILQTMLPEAILKTYNKDNIDVLKLEESIKWANAIVMGPGMGINKNTKTLIEVLLRTASVPVVIDADGINTLAKYPELMDACESDLILTPHLAEMARLINKDIDEIKDDLLQTAENYAKKEKLVCVLKDARTVVANATGQIYLNQSGNSGMATAGSGDVLTGIIAGLLAQGMDALEASTLGVYVHGLAGECASSKIGEYSVMADDIIDNLSDVLRD